MRQQRYFDGPLVHSVSHTPSTKGMHSSVIGSVWAILMCCLEIRADAKFEPEGSCAEPEPIPITN